MKRRWYRPDGVKWDDPTDDVDPVPRMLRIVASCMRAARMRETPGATRHADEYMERAADVLSGAPMGTEESNLGLGRVLSRQLRVKRVSFVGVMKKIAREKARPAPLSPEDQRAYDEAVAAGLITPD